MSYSSDSQLVQECAICLDNCLNGVRLNCNHVFCYLCVKGSAQQSNNRCPVCRRPIPNGYFENPDLIEEIDLKAVPSVEGMQWQYEGRNGWWLYDSRHSRDIEKAFASNEPSVEVLIAGFVYVIDFQQMIQFRRHQPNRIRRIRRHAIDPNITKGVAGLRTNFNDVPQVMDTSLQNNSNDNQCSGVDSEEPSQVVSDSNVESNAEPNIESNSSEQNISEDNEENDSNSDVLQLTQTLDTSLNLRDSRETYL